MKCKRTSIRLAYTLIFLLYALSFKVSADEGWWTRSSISGGSLYSEVEHPDIALEKEVLIYYGGGKCEVHFLFKNTAEKPVNVVTGFPIKISFPLYGFSSIDPSITYIQQIYDKKSINEQNYHQFIREFHEDSASLNINKVISRDAFDAMNLVWGKGRELIKGFSVMQGGQPVNIDSVFIEGKALQGDSLAINIHFLHTLSFLPGQTSTVIVKYSLFSQVMDSGSAGGWTKFYVWRYILGTGRTWKGAIGRIYFILPDFLIPNLPDPIVHAGGFKKKAIYFAMDYEPSLEDEVEVSYIKYVNIPYGSHIFTPGEMTNLSDSTYLIKSIPVPTRPAQSFVAVRKASSFLRQSTWVHSFQSINIPRSDSFWNAIFSKGYYTAFYDTSESDEIAYFVEGVRVRTKNIGFAPLSLFDGIPESAWCEGVQSDGINEWVEFELKEDVLGLAVHNGFKKVSWFWGMKHAMFQGEKVVVLDTTRYEQLKSIYGKNNRIRLLEIISMDGKIKHHLNLKDTSARQEFKHIYLPKGVYRLFIREVYKGTRWNDSCIGELVFYSASARMLVEADPFLNPTSPNFSRAYAILLDLRPFLRLTCAYGSLQIFTLYLLVLHGARLIARAS